MREIVISADRLPLNKDLRHGTPLRALDHFLPAVGVGRDVDFLVGELFRLQQGLGFRTIRAPLFGIELYVCHGVTF